MKRRFLYLFIGSALLVLNSAPAVRAVTTDKVDHDTFADFNQGEFDNVSLNSDGHLALAPAITNLASATDPIIWSAVQDAHGNLLDGRPIVTRGRARLRGGAGRQGHCAPRRHAHPWGGLRPYHRAGDLRARARGRRRTPAPRG